MGKHKTIPLSTIATNLPEELSFRKFHDAYLKAIASGVILAVPVEGTFKHRERTIKEDLVLDTPAYKAWYEQLVSAARLAHQRSGLVVERAAAEASEAEDLEELARRYQQQVSKRKAVRSLKPRTQKASTRPKLPRTRTDVAEQPAPPNDPSGRPDDANPRAAAGQQNDPTPPTHSEAAADA